MRIRSPLEKIARLSRSFARVAGTHGPVQAIRETVRFGFIGAGGATKEELAALCTEVAAQRAQFETQLTEVAALRAEAEARRAEITALHAEVAAQHTEVAALIAEAEAQHLEATSLHAEIATQHAEGAALRTEAATVNTELAARRIEGGALRAELAAQGAESATRRAEAVALHAQVAAQHLEVAACQSEVAALRAEIESQHASRSRQASSIRWLVEHQPRASNVIADASRELVSIVMPVWNRETLIGAAIESVQHQAYRSWELLVIDDGSTDATAAAIARYSDDQRIRYLRQDHVGQCAARNRALKESRGEIIAYLDSDETWYPNHLSEIVSAFAANPDRDTAYTAQLVSGPAEGEEWIRDQPFDRDRLRAGNFIDVNCFAHRQRVYERLGGFDERMTRLVDWDLILRYTADSEPLRISVITSHYHGGGWPRVSNTESAHLALYQVSKKLASPEITRSSPQLKVLYALEHYSALSESSIATEIACMRRRGVRIEAWSGAERQAPIGYETDVPIHCGSLQASIEKMQPHLVHAHHLRTALSYLPIIKDAGLRMTIRENGCKFNEEMILAAARTDTIARVFQLPHLTSPGIGDKVTTMNPCFDPELYHPGVKKDDRLVVQTGFALGSKDMETFVRVAYRCPDHRFVLVIYCDADEPDRVGQLMELNRSLGDPATVLSNLPRCEIRDLVQQSAIYLDTSPFAMSVAIAEAMATGCYILGPGSHAAAAFIGEAGRVYNTEDEVVELISETSSWDEEGWRRARVISIDRAFGNFAGPGVLEPLYREWLSIAGLNTHHH